MESKGWKKYALDDVCSVTDCQHKTAPTVKEETKYRMLRTTNIRNGKIDAVNTRSVSQETYLKWSIRGFLEEGDVILTREAPMGEVGIIRKEKYNLFLGQRLLQLKAKKNLITSEFLFYSLQGRELQHQIRMNEGTGSVVSNIRIPILKKMEIYVPDLNTQIRVVDSLKALDEKIALNELIIANLKQLIQTLFKRWFVDFEFPNEFGEPYKSSGGEMIESCMGLIPEKWEAKEIGDVIELSYGKALKSENRIPGRYPVYGSNGIVDYHNIALVEGPGIIVGRKGTVGTVNLEHENFFPIDTAFYVTRKNKDLNWNYLFLVLASQNFAELSGDSAVPGLNRKHAYKNKFILPCISVVRNFDKTIDNIFNEIYSLEKEIEKLADIRDTLLPKLLSGEIELPDEIEVADHVPIP